jgi:hypothetical protein
MEVLSTCISNGILHSMAWKVKSHGFLSKTNAEVFGSSILSLYSDLTSWLSEPFFDTFKFLLIIKQKYGFFISLARDSININWH